MRFAEPWYLLLFIPFALAFWFARKRPAWRHPELGVSSLAALPPTAGIRARAARLLPGLRPLAVALILLAAARPQAGREIREVVSEGIDIILAIDLSGSMRSEDFRPRNRLFVAKQVAKEFVRGRVQDRIGLVAFAGRSELISPLTLDYDGLCALIDGLDFGQLPDGTAVGAAIAQSAERLDRAPGKSKVLILLTDGINNAGAVDPVTAARLAKAVGVRIYAIGAGTQGAAPFPVDDPLLGRLDIAHPDRAHVLHVLLDELRGPLGHVGKDLGLEFLAGRFEGDRQFVVIHFLQDRLDPLVVDLQDVLASHGSDCARLGSADGGHLMAKCAFDRAKLVAVEVAHVHARLESSEVSLFLHSPYTSSGT